jgi:hypothetical protein
LYATCGGTQLKKTALVAAGFHFFAPVLLKIQFFFTLKIETRRPFETWGNIYLLMQQNIPEDMEIPLPTLFLQSIVCNIAFYL